MNANIIWNLKKMVKIDKVEINGFCSFSNFKLNFKENINIIVGTNGVGKSNLLKLINCALFNPNDLILYVNNNCSVINNNANIKLYFKLNASEINLFNNLYALNVMAHMCNLVNNIYQIKMDIFIHNFIKQLYVFVNGLMLEYKYVNNKITTDMYVLNKTNITNIDTLFMDLNKNIIPQYELIQDFFEEIRKHNTTISKKITNIIDTLKSLNNNIKTNTQDAINTCITRLQKNSKEIMNIYPNIITLDISDPQKYCDSIYELLKTKFLLMNDENTIKYCYDINEKNSKYFKEHLLEILNLNDVFSVDAKGNSILELINKQSTNNVSLSHYRQINISNTKTEFGSSYQLSSYILFFIKESIKTISVNARIKVHTTLDESDKVNSLKTFGLNYKTHMTKIHESIYKINNDYKIMHRLYNNKLNNNNIFNTMQKTFDTIMKKRFDIIITNDPEMISEYEYIIIDGLNKYPCSTGETDMINFLAEYYFSDNKILLIDEPCTRLSAQNKINFRKEIFETDKNTDKQIIMVTHDIELISDKTCENIIMLNMNNGLSVNKLQFLDEARRKLLFEHREILFAKKCLLIEGYDDYRVYKEVLNEFECSNDYMIVIMNGCGSNVWELLNELEIDYKIIYDVDKLHDKPSIDEIKNIIHNKKISKILVNQLICNLKYPNSQQQFIDHMANKYNLEKDKYNIIKHKLNNNNKINIREQIIDEIKSLLNDVVFKGLNNITNKPKVDTKEIIQMTYKSILIWDRDYVDLETVCSEFMNATIVKKKVNPDDKFLIEFTSKDFRDKIAANKNTSNALQILKDFLTTPTMLESKPFIINDNIKRQINNIEKEYINKLSKKPG